MTNTDQAVNVSQAIYDILFLNKQELGIEDVWDGDEQLIGKYPSLCVIQGEKTRELTGAPFRTDNNFNVFVMVYHGAVRDSQLNYRDANTLAERVEALLHQDKTLGGIVVHGFVVSIEPGVVDRGTLQYVSRLTWRGLTKTLT